MHSKRIAILGSTGSIGCSALEVIEHRGTPYSVSALAAHRNLDKLIEQAKRYKPSAIAICDESLAEDLSRRAKELPSMKLYVGACGLSEMVCRDDVDMVLAAVVGSAGLRPVLAAIGAGKQIALANKESLVVGGSLIIPEARKRGVQILPVDSEHSAIFQAMQCGRHDEIHRVILTASGGPFRSASAEEIDRATLAEALNHPTWRMGGKITIDSATMFNKALELIEACWLFDLPPEKVEVVIHPESVIHSMVEFVDGSTIAQLSPPDMRTPIQYALTFPQRKAGIGRRMDFKSSFSLNFHAPDPQRFAALRLGYEVAAQRGTTAGAVFNAANEVAVAAFMQGRIRFGMISRIVELTMQSSSIRPQPTLEDLLAADRGARELAEIIIRDQRQGDTETRRHGEKAT